MKTLLIVFVIHYCICITLLVLRILTKIHSEFTTLFIAFFIPVWGLIFLLYKHKSDKHSERQSEPITIGRPVADEEKKSVSVEQDDSNIVPLAEAIAINDRATKRDMMLDVLFDINKSIVVDEDDIRERIVPLEEALVVNDTATRRALIIDVLYSNPSDFVSQLFDAKANGDTEVVHYAATALTEIQKDFDLKFKDIMNRRADKPNNDELDLEYMKLLEKYISSGLLEGDGLKNQLRNYSRLISDELKKENVKGRWALANKKANADLQLKDVSEFDKDIEYMMERWPEREGTYMFRMQGAILKKDKGLIEEIISQIKEKNIYLSSELRSLIRFWDGDFAEDGKRSLEAQ